MMLHIIFNQDWQTGFRDIQVQKCEIFVTQGQVTLKWVVWFGPKSNSTELLCLSWSPATLMMIQSKMNELAWRHHFPIYGKYFRPSRAANSVVSGPIWPNFELVRDFMLIRPEIKLVRAFMPVLVTSNFDDDSIKNEQASMETAFSPLLVCGNFLDAQGQLTTEKNWRHRFPPLKVNGGFLLLWKPEFWSKLPQNLALEIFKFENVDDDDGRTTDHWYTISSPCEPSAQVS